MMPFVPPQHKAQRPPDQMMQHAGPKASILVIVVVVVAVLPVSSPPLDLVPLMPPGIGRSVDNVPYFRHRDSSLRGNAGTADPCSPTG
jgi:hypothetical protein